MQSDGFLDVAHNLLLKFLVSDAGELARPIGKVLIDAGLGEGWTSILFRRVTFLTRLFLDDPYRPPPVQANILLMNRSTTLRSS